MIKNNGVTFIALVIMITVILILTSIFVATGLDALKESENTERENEIYQLKQAINSRFASFVKNDGRIGLIGKLPESRWTGISECINEVIGTLEYETGTEEDKEGKKQKINTEITRDYDTYVRVIYSGDMARLGLENYSEDNAYLVDYYTGSVYGPLGD